MWLAITGVLAAPAARATTTNAVVEANPPVATNSYWTPLEIDPAIYSTPYRLSLFRPENGEDGARVWSQTKSLFFYGLGVFTVLAVMPESMTGWESTDSIFDKWVENVKEGPVWDRDNAIYNYVGHTYSGGVYYQVARKSGYRQWDAFVYTALMSTFYWEYGVEAFAETPSIQDLVITPVLGWVYGEWAYQTELGIRKQGNEVMGSKALGGVSLFFLDPIDSIGRGVNWVVRRRLIKAGYGYFSYSAAPIESSDGSTTTDHTVYLNMKIPIGGSSSTPESFDPSHFQGQNDPVDTGIVGFTLGGGHSFLDKKWGYEDGYYTKATLGLYFTPRFSSRVAYLRGDVRDIKTGDSVIYENYSLDAQYYFISKQKFRPYVTAGFGEQLWDEDNDQKTFQWNAGLGLHWKVHRKWALQADWINYFSSSSLETHDQTLNASIVYRFGRGEHTDW